MQLKEEAGALKDRLLRTAADMENLRKRAEREKAEATLYAATNFARDLLSVADNMSRALAAMPAVRGCATGMIGVPRPVPSSLASCPSPRRAWATGIR